MSEQSIYKHGKQPYVIVNKNILDISASIVLLEPSSHPLTQLINALSKVDKDYEDAKELIREVTEEIEKAGWFGTPIGADLLRPLVDPDYEAAKDLIREVVSAQDPETLPP